NINGTSESQILNIINQYKKILDNDSLKKFPRVKIKPISDIIKKSYNNSKNKKSLLDALYYMWVLGKDEKFLLENKYTKKRIEETNILTKELIDYLYEE